MAKKTRSASVSASIDYMYDSFPEMPWDEIEAAAQKKFKDDEKYEIYLCANTYSSEKSWYDAGVPVAELKELQEQLQKHCKAIYDLGKRYLPQESNFENEKGHPVVEALNILLNREERFIFRDAFDTTAEAACRLYDGLTEEDGKMKNLFDDNVDITYRFGKSLALEAFIKAVLFEAVSKPARRGGGFENSQTKEYQCWGIPVGPKSVRFAKFASKVLKQKFSVHQIRDAFPEEPCTQSKMVEDLHANPKTGSAKSD
ncbi:MAG: hypothetical protein HRU33_12290 [Rhodobacteraceae bacterium]|nr:hypothetical protein [Paracoccaceae bacterium]